MRIQAALELSSLAESCYSPEEVPRAVWSQRAALFQLAGQDEQSRRCEQQAYFSVNPRDPQMPEKILVEKIKKQNFV